MSGWELYDAIADGVPIGLRAERIFKNEWWTLCESSARGQGLAMSIDWAQRPALYPDGLAGMPLRDAAYAARSWDLSEAAAGLSAANAFYNTPERLAALGCAEPYENFCTDGIDMTGQSVGVIGHLKMPPETLAAAKEVFVLERAPREGDYPDSACEYLLPRCGVVIITGSSLVNKTLPRLLELSRGARVILTGPSVPMCPALLELGIDRLAGLVPTDAAGLRAHVAGDIPGPPYGFGQTFLLGK